MKYLTLQNALLYAGKSFSSRASLNSLINVRLPKYSSVRRCYGSDSAGSHDNLESTLRKARERLSPLGHGNISLVKDDTTGIATITLRHQDKRNALSGRMMVELMDIASDLEDWQVGRGVLLQSEGEVFCSGGDLTTVSSITTPADGHLMATLMHNTLTRLRCLPLVSVCLVQGRALGGGAELTTVTDFRLFTKSGEVGFVQGVMGVSPGWGGGTRLVQLVGAKAALELLLTARRVDAEAALQMGLADDIITDHTTRYEQTMLWLTKLIKFEPEVIHAMKRLVVTARDSSMKESLDQEKLLFTSLWGGPINLKALGKNIKH